MSRRPILGVLCACVLSFQLRGAEAPVQPSSPGINAAGAAPAGTNAVSATASADDLKQLRQRIAQQEEAIKQLQKSVEEQRTLLEKISNTTATTAPVNTVAVANGSAPVQLAPAVNVARPRAVFGRQNLQAANPSPLSIRIGDSTFTPLGFIDATVFGRSTSLGSSLGTNFGAIPYNNVPQGHISENNFTTQNSRIGFRVDSTVLGAKVLGYFEADFLGNQPTNVFVTSNSDTFRMRNVFVDVQKDGFEVLGGQDWSFATPNRKGLSPLPSDVFFTQNMDTNYQVGLVWSRQTQFRFIAHPNENVAFGVSLENPQQYIGGSAGGSSVTLPSAVNSNTAVVNEFNNGANSFSSANLHPDIIFKAAYDGHIGDGQVMHVEAAGLVRTFRDVIPAGTPTTYRSSAATAASGEVNANLEVRKNFRIIANTFFGSGNGRYVFGQAPDVVVRADGSISPIHTYSTVDGFEANLHKNTLLDMYYGGIYIKRDVAVDTNRSFVGYGYPGSPAGQNRSIQEGTIGITQTIWKSPSYGALSLITQYSYLTRNPWAILTGAPRATHASMYWIDLRYTLP